MTGNKKVLKDAEYVNRKVSYYIDSKVSICVDDFVEDYILGFFKKFPKKNIVKIDYEKVILHTYEHGISVSTLIDVLRERGFDIEIQPNVGISVILPTTIVNPNDT